MLVSEALEAINAVSDTDALQLLKFKYAGRKQGSIASF